MATVLIAKNITGPAVPVVLENLGVTVPASGQLTLTDVQLFVDEILADPELQNAVANDELVLNDGVVDLPKAAVLGWGAPATAGGVVKARTVSSLAQITTTLAWVTALSVVVPETGDWLLLASASIVNTSNNDIAQIGIRVNGGAELAKTLRPYEGNDVGSATTTTDLPAMTAGDVVDLRVGHQSGPGSTISGAREIVIWKVELV